MPRLAFGPRVDRARLNGGGPQGPPLAQAEFDVFLTADRNLSFQQNTTKFQIAVVVLVAGSTQLNKTLPLMPKVLALLPGLTPGQVAIVNS
jgi:hypothetical protein